MTSQVALVLRSDPEGVDSCPDSGANEGGSVENRPLRCASDNFFSPLPDHDTFTDRVLKFLGARNI